MPEETVPNVGHGSKIGQNKFDCALVFAFIPLVVYSPYTKPVGHGSIGLLQAFKKILRTSGFDFSLCIIKTI